MIALGAAIVAGLLVWLWCEAVHAEDIDARAAEMEEVRRRAFAEGYDERDRVERIRRQLAREKASTPPATRARIEAERARVLSLQCAPVPVMLALSSAAGATLGAGVFISMLAAVIVWRLAARVFGFREEECDGLEVPSLRAAVIVAAGAVLVMGIVYRSSSSACSALLEIVRPAPVNVTNGSYATYGKAGR